MSQNAANRLCLDCGLCCNGVLFDQVVLQPEDNAKALSAIGLKIKKKQFFAQPCSALCGVLCTIYADRPVRCRKFVCRQHQKVAAGKLTEEAAMSRIREVQQQVAAVEKLLGLSSDDNLRKSLAQRFANAMAVLPETEAETSPYHTELAEAIKQLQAQLGEHFRV